MERHKIEGNFVLDTSVLIKWFSNEEDTDIAVELRDNYVKGNANITCPDLVVYELINALRYNKALTEKDVKDSINSLLSIGINIIVPTRQVVESAIAIAFQHEITVYDAYFVALAKELNFTYITADEKLYSKIKKLSFVKFLKNIYFSSYFIKT